MRLFLITLAMSTTGAVILIIALLVVSCIIGYITAWFYAKSIYTPIIKGLENDKVQLNNVISGLKDEISRLNAKIEDLNITIKENEKVISENEKVISEMKKVILEKEKEISEKDNIISKQVNEIEQLKKKITDKVS